MEAKPSLCYRCVLILSLKHPIYCSMKYPYKFSSYLFCAVVAAVVVLRLADKEAFMLCPTVPVVILPWLGGLASSGSSGSSDVGLGGTGSVISTRTLHLFWIINDCIFAPLVEELVKYSALCAAVRRCTMRTVKSSALYRVQGAVSALSMREDRDGRGQSTANTRDNTGDTASANCMPPSPAQDSMQLSGTSYLALACCVSLGIKIADAAQRILRYNSMVSHSLPAAAATLLTSPSTTGSSASSGASGAGGAGGAIGASELLPGCSVKHTGGFRGGLEADCYPAGALTGISGMHGAFYALLRGIYPIQELAGAISTLGLLVRSSNSNSISSSRLTKQGLWASSRPQIQYLAGAVLLHCTACFQGMRPLIDWESSSPRPWQDMQWFCCWEWLRRVSGLGSHVPYILHVLRRHPILNRLWSSVFQPTVVTLEEGRSAGCCTSYSQFFALGGLTAVWYLIIARVAIWVRSAYEDIQEAAPKTTVTFSDLQRQQHRGFRDNGTS